MTRGRLFDISINTSQTCMKFEADTSEKNMKTCLFNKIF